MLANALHHTHTSCLVVRLSLAAPSRLSVDIKHKIYNNLSYERAANSKLIHIDVALKFSRSESHALAKTLDGDGGGTANASDDNNKRANERPNKKRANI